MPAHRVGVVIDVPLERYPEYLAVKRVETLRDAHGHIGTEETETGGPG